MGMRLDIIKRADRNLDILQDFIVIEPKSFIEEDAYEKKYWEGRSLMYKKTVRSLQVLIICIFMAIVGFGFFSDQVFFKSITLFSFFIFILFVLFYFISFLFVRYPIARYQVVIDETNFHFSKRILFFKKKFSINRAGINKIKLWQVSAENYKAYKEGKYPSLEMGGWETHFLDNNNLVFAFKILNRGQAEKIMKSVMNHFGTSAITYEN